MRFTSSSLAALCLFFSLSSAVLGQSELEARGKDDKDDYGKGGDKDDHDKHKSPCFPFIIEKACVRGRCNDSHKCELGFSIDPIRLCCVHQSYRRGEDDYGHDNGKDKDQDKKCPKGGKNGHDGKGEGDKGHQGKGDKGHQGGKGGYGGGDQGNQGHGGGSYGGY
ncbi:hypothetical protein B0H19DRAFT_1239094 [Mycena capillaripes]|nr:hypothetical protein B0H19DRAFT_1239094 [Mycena capillaripes]